MNINIRQFKSDQVFGIPSICRKPIPQAGGLVGWWPLKYPNYDVREDRSHFSFATFPVEAGIPSISEQ